MNSGAANSNMKRNTNCFINEHVFSLHFFQRKENKFSTTERYATRITTETNHPLYITRFKDSIHSLRIITINGEPKRKMRKNTVPNQNSEESTIEPTITMHCVFMCFESKAYSTKASSTIWCICILTDDRMANNNTVNNVVMRKSLCIRMHPARWTRMKPLYSPSTTIHPLSIVSVIRIRNQKSKKKRKKRKWKM